MVFPVSWISEQTEVPLRELDGLLEDRQAEKKAEKRLRVGQTDK